MYLMQIHPGQAYARPFLSFFILLNLLATCVSVIEARDPSSNPANRLDRRAEPDPPRALPKRATDKDALFQPAMDFDTDSCYNVPAVDAQGNTAVGLPETYPEWEEDRTLINQTFHCRDESDLRNSNVYSRQRCNNGWCAYMYAYYFERDFADGFGHRHDWEHVVVWVRDAPSTCVNLFVCTSAHGAYSCRKREDVRFDTGDHPKIVYHKDGISTHAMRFANNNDEPPENHDHAWKYADLVSYNGFPANVRDKLFNGDFGGATLGIKDSRFKTELDAALKGITASACPGGAYPPSDFDTSVDVGSPGTPGGGTTEPPPEQVTKVRAMIVGDSITHGIEGDYTWRYRLWEWMRSQGVTATFVGPYTGTVQPRSAEEAIPKPPLFVGEVPPQEPLRNSGAYARDVSTDFPKAHFANWGRQAAQAKLTIAEQVRAHQPDYLFVAIGFNDLGWFVSGAKGTLDSVKTLIANARSANPNIKIALANVPQRSAIGGREDLPPLTDEYNKLLRSEISNGGFAPSTVHLVELQERYDCGVGGCSAGYDGLHPNAKGEYQIAQAFSETLVNKFGIGKSPIIPPGGVGTRAVTKPSDSTFEVHDLPSGLAATWTPVFGVAGYTIGVRLKDQAAWSEYSINTPRYDNTWVLNNMEWEFRVRSHMGDNVVSDWTVIKSKVAHPQTAPGPSNIVTSAAGGGAISVSWQAVTGHSVDRYGVLIFDTSAPGAFVQGWGVRGTSFSMGGFIAGHKYVVAVQTWTSVGGGFPAAGPEVIVT